VEHGSTGSRAGPDDSAEHGSTDDAGVTIRLTALDGEHGFAVEDDGPGVDPAHRDSVFERGYTTSDDGTGFGLAIVRSIADAHGWSVGLAESDAGGARFEFGFDR
jgi:signal transduction histidine kinase